MKPDEIDPVVARVQQGDKDAFRQLFYALEREVRIFIGAKVHNPDLVDEILQSTFVACYERIRDYEPRGTFASWLKGIARNYVLRELDARRRCRSAEGEELEAVLSRGMSEVVEDLSEAEEDVERLRRCLDHLQPRSRSLVEARYMDGLPVARIAEIYKRTANWVSVKLHRIRELLRACLAREERTA